MNQFCHLCEIEFNDWEVFAYHMHKHKTDLMNKKTKPMDEGVGNKRMTPFEEALDEVLEDLRATLISKNKNYGNSFFNQIDEWGPAAIMIPIANKTDRLRTLYKNGDDVQEPITDSLKDLSGYGVLSLVHQKLRG